MLRGMRWDAGSRVVIHGEQLVFEVASITIQISECLIRLHLLIRSICLETWLNSSLVVLHGNRVHGLGRKDVRSWIIWVGTLIATLSRLIGSIVRKTYWGFLGYCLNGDTVESGLEFRRPIQWLLWAPAYLARIGGEFRCIHSSAKRDHSRRGGGRRRRRLNQILSRRRH